MLQTFVPYFGYTCTCCISHVLDWLWNAKEKRWRLIRRNWSTYCSYAFSNSKGDKVNEDSFCIVSSGNTLYCMKTKIIKHILTGHLGLAEWQQIVLS